MRTKAMKQRMGLALSDNPVTVTPQLMEQYLNSLEAGDRQKQTIHTYRRSIEDLYDYLPPDKEIRQDTLKEWKKYLKECGYSDNTINTRLTAANGFLRFNGREELATVHERIAMDEPMAVLTRKEYVQFLSKVRDLGTEKCYFVVKVFASVDIGFRELEYLTVEALREGVINLPDEKRAFIPACLKEELLQYADRHGIREGTVFVTRSGSLIDRSNISKLIHQTAVQVGVEPEKCSPSALHRMFLMTQRELMDQLMPVYRQSYENLLDIEQAVVAWNQ